MQGELGPTEEHFRSWLHGLGTGCEFASSLTDKKLFFCYSHSATTFLKADVTTVTTLITSAVAAKQPAYALFPHIRTAPGITRMLETLNGEGGWTVKRVPWRLHERDAAVLLGVYWKTSSGPLSSAIGFAPLGTMPATRRAPFVAIGVWGGGQDNPHLRRRAKDSEVGIADIPTEHRSKERHKAKMESTTARVRALLSEPPEDIEHLRKVAFCLPRHAVRAALFRDAS